MSTNPNDMNPIITHANYEEYFLLYVDNELSEQERAMVEAFLQFHPELQAELDLLVGTKLEPEVFAFDGKAQLFSENIREQSIDEALLLHVDNELDEAGKQDVARKLDQDEAYRRQHQLLLRTKSDPAEVVPYPNKKELYRHSVYRMRFGFALRVAAAVLLIASLGVLFWMQNDPVPDSAPVAATQPGKPASTQTVGTEEHAVAAIPTPEGNNQPIQAPAVAAKVREQALAASVARNDKPLTERSAVAGTNPRPVPAAVTPAVAETELLAQAHAPRISEQDLPRMEASKKIMEATVTPQPSGTLEYAAPVVEPVFAASREEGNRNIKSLLRRATRLVERRTGISTTNDDDELLIGVVAVKLK